jgi:hypothetical protein
MIREPVEPQKHLLQQIRGHLRVATYRQRGAIYKVAMAIIKIT